ncbi:tail fiber domain-containing protein [Streptococcus oralis]|uniref:tail fiber domain-containing protein n=1 Tax=Streptococcus oralis TaxID=1303 RepID=UPI001E351995|nr:tail fiber domain-containing protein [Streptococcus oralis]
MIKEICLKTGIELANEYMDITSMNYVIDKIPKEKKMTFRDVLSSATQMLGMSCFFNREGKLEIKELTESGITITADSYFMHGLTKSEVQYQIAGITCKKEKETLTVGMRTGLSLELDNLFMSQTILDNLYHKIKDIRYYPFNLNYQGHLLLDVGQWVTIKTNKGETFKSPILSQSFTFKGGLRGRIGADSKSGNDAQYSYAGTFTKKIEQFSEFEKQIQNQIEEAGKGFDKKVEKIKNDFNDQVELAKAKVEEVKKSLTETIDQRFRDFDSIDLNEIKQKADDALRNAGAGSLLAQEAKQISEQARQQMDSKFAEYKQSVDGRFTSLSSRLDGKANLVDFQRVQETSKLYERIIGSNENDISNKVARMALTNQLFQVEVAKSVGDSRNYVKNADFRDGSKNWKESNISGLNFNYEHSSRNRNKSGVHIYGTSINTRYFGLQQTFKIELKKSDKITLSFLISKDGLSTFSGLDVGLHYRKDGAIKSQAWKEIPNSDITASTYKKLNFNYELPVDIDEINLMFYGNPGKSINLYISEIKLETGNNVTPFTLAPEDTDEAIRTVQSQLAGSWAIQNLTSAGSIVSQINATNNQILIEAEKIRLKGKTLLDELTAIDGYFKRLFVGEGNFAKLNAEIIGSKTITADKLIMDSAMARMFVSSDIFTDTLAAKEAFINKLRSVVVSATLLEGYKGKIGGFQIGTHDKDPSVYWLTSVDHFSVGMGTSINGPGKWRQTALWVNWGNDWNTPGNNAWFVNNAGQMYCYNSAHFWETPEIHGNLKVSGDIYYVNSKNQFSHWIYSDTYKRISKSNDYLYLYKSGSTSYDWIPINKEISDRRYKSNIEASTVSGLDVIEQLKTYSYRKEYDGKVKDISCGIMAQDVQKYAPEAFYENPDGAYSYRTFELVPYLIKAIQELNQKIEKLEKTA